METRQTKPSDPNPKEDVPAWMDPLCGLFLFGSPHPMGREVKREAVLLVEDLRVVPMDESKELEDEIWKIYSKIGVVVEDGVLVPVDFADRETLGYCFIQFSTHQECELAMEKTAQFKSERLHIFADSTPGDNLQKCLRDEKAKARDNCVTCNDLSTEVTMQKLVLDEKASDKFVGHAGSHTEFLCDDASRENPEPVFKHLECEQDMEKIAQFELERLHIFADKTPGENVPAWMDPSSMFLFGFPLFLGLEMKREVHQTIMVEDLRVVPEDESKKLEAEIWEIYSQTGLIVEGGVHVPVDFVDRKTLGYCFIRFSTNQECELAMKKTAQYKKERLPIFADKTPGVCLENLQKGLLDEKATSEDDSMITKISSTEENLQIWLPDEKAKSKDDSETTKISSTEETREEVVMNEKTSDQFVVHAGSDTELLCDDANRVKPELVFKLSENLPKLHSDVKARDQFVLHAGLEIEVFRIDAKRWKPKLLQRVSFSTVRFFQWSPLGTHMATVHRHGVAVWGGATTFRRLMRCAHQQVELIDFSPGENFLVTYSSHEVNNPCNTNGAVIKFFDTRTGKIARCFKGHPEEFSSGGVNGVSWPVFKWSGGTNDKYFARIAKNVVSVYDTETPTPTHRASIKVENVVDFSWSPTDPILALFSPELDEGNQPAQVSLVQIPSKEVLRRKKLFRSRECRMHWQSNGYYLAVKVDRYTKSGKSTKTCIELFRIKKCDIPNEVVELENKNDKIISFAWEPSGHRFAFIHGDGQWPVVSFFSMCSGTYSGCVTKLKTVHKCANELYWSPVGKHVVLAGLKGLDGQLAFYNVDELETMATVKHFMATNVEWDPTGRFVVTLVTSSCKTENGFNVWSFDGKLLYRKHKDDIFEFLWRPRPQSFSSLGPEPEKEETAKNLRQVTRKSKQTKQKKPNLMKNMIEKVDFGLKLVCAKNICICV